MKKVKLNIQADIQTRSTYKHFVFDVDLSKRFEKAAIFSNIQLFRYYVLMVVLFMNQAVDLYVRMLVL